MRYVLVHWFRGEENEPIAFYHEADEDGHEVRRVEVFRDGKMGYISASNETEDSFLTDETIPTTSELNEDTDPEDIKAEDITQDEFEAIWKKAVAMP